MTHHASFQGEIDGVVTRYGLPGLVAAVTRGGETVWAGGAGMADLDRGIPMRPHHIVRVASITKMFTATAIFILRDEGRLDIDDPVAVHVSEFPDATRTIRQLLCHGAGLQRETPDDPGWRHGDFLFDREFIEALGRAHLPFPAMHRFKYSNLGYGTLGEVVARVSGTAYEDFVRQRIFEPLDLQDCGFDPAAIPDERRAQGYLPQPDTDAVILDERAWAPIPKSMGGSHASVEDLCTFVTFLAGFRDGPLEAATREEMRYPAIPAGPDLTSAYALGPEVRRHGDRLLLGHAGGLFSFASLVLVDLRTGVACAAVTNVGDGGPLPDLVPTLIGLVDGAAAPNVAIAEPVPDDLQPLLGRYFGDGAVLVLKWRGNRLEADVSSPSGIPLPPSVPIAREGDKLVFSAGSYVGEQLEPDASGDGFFVCGYRFDRI